MRKPVSRFRREPQKLASRRYKFRGLMRDIIRDELKSYDCQHVNKHEAATCPFCDTWDAYYDTWDAYYNDDCWTDDYDNLNWNLDLKLKSLRDLADELLLGTLFQRHRPLFHGGSSPAPGPKADEDLGPIEQRLFKHCWYLRYHHDNVGLMNAIFHKLPEQLGQGDASLLWMLGETHQSLAVLFSPFWVRSMNEVTDELSNNPSRVFEQLFVREDAVAGGVCHHFQFEEDDLTNPEGLLWTILVGSQASLYRASKLFGWPIRAKTQYYIEKTLRSGWPQQPMGYEDCSSERLLALAEVQRLGATPEQAENIVRGLGYVTLAQQKRCNECHQTWCQVVCWLLNHLMDIPIDDRTVVINWIRHEMTEAERRGTCFMWRPRSIKQMVNAARVYQQRIFKPTPTVLQCWNKLGLSWEWLEGETRWTMDELTTTAELAQEGQELHHCVASYSGRCVAGACVILSLKKDGERCLTVEFAPNSRTILQARGLCNRAASSEEWTVLNRWLGEVRHAKKGRIQRHVVFSGSGVMRGV